MLKGFKLEASDAMEVVSKLTKVDMVAAASAGSIAEALRQFATTAQLSGVNIDQAIAMATTIMDVSQKDASSVGNALKTMIARYGNVKAGAYTSTSLDAESSDTTEKLNDIEKVLNKIGISMRTTTLEFRDFDDVLEDIADKWADLDNVSQNAIATAVAGVRQRESFLVLMENMDKYHDLIQTSAESAGTAEEKYLSYTEQLEASQKRISAAWEEIALNSDVANFMTNVNNLLSYAIKSLPFIVKYVARIITMTQAYKLPAFLNLGQKVSGIGGTIKTAFTDRKTFGEKMEGYERTSRFGGGSTSIFRNLADAIKLNSTAINKNTVATNANTKTKNRTAENLPEVSDEEINPNVTPKTNKFGKFTQFGLNALVAGATASTQGVNLITGKAYDMSTTAVTANRVVTGLAGGIGSLFGPVVGMIASTLADILMSHLIGPLIDRVENQIKHEIEVAENNLSALEAIANNTAEMVQVSKDNSESFESFQKIAETYDSMLKVLTENKDVATNLLELMGNKYSDIYELMNEWKTNSEKRAEISRELKIAEKQAEISNKLVAEQRVLNSGFKQRDLWNRYNQAIEILQHMDKNNPDYSQLSKTRIAYWNTATVEENLAIITKQRDELADTIKETEAEMARVNKEINTLRAESGILQAQTTTGDYLADLNVEQLKYLGKDEIERLVVEAIQKSGGFTGYSVYSEEGQQLVEEIIKKNEKLYKVYTQQAYTLNEALSLQNEDLLLQFANAMGIAVDELSEAAKKFGTLTLGDFLKTPTEIRNSFDELSNLFVNLGSSSGLTAENLEKIISNYPQLIKDIGNTGDLTSAILTNMMAYKEQYSNALTDTLLDSSAYFKVLRDSFSADSEEGQAIINSGAKTIRELLTRGVDNENVKNKIQELFGEVVGSFDKQYLETIIKAQTKMFDQQIKNLEEQKTALQEINKQREYENKLIEARNKLESAQKEKKRVWREGVGWTYEADQTAILEAQQNLEEVTNQKKISELQSQIDIIQTSKEQLEKLPTDMETKNLESVYEQWKDSLGENTKTQAQIIQTIQDTYNGILKTSEDVYQYVQQSNVNKVKGFATQYEKLEESRTNLPKDTTTEEYAKAETQYNTASKELFTKVDKFISEGGSMDTESDLYKWYQTQKGEYEKAETEGTTYQPSQQYSPEFELNGKKYKLKSLQPDSGLTNKMQENINSRNKDLRYQYPGSDSTEVITNQKIKDKYITFESFLQDPPFDKKANAVFVNANTDWGLFLRGNAAPNGTGIYGIEAAAKGSLGLKGGLSLVNELGTEAIVTPNGTITSLPSATGVVPAEVTKNLWQLGNIAPALMGMLRPGWSQLNPLSSGGNNNTDESFNVGTVNMTVNADDTFDVDAWVNEIKVKTALSRNTR